MFGDAALGALNLKMIATARSVGAAAKFTGSGGAIVCFCPLGEGQEALLQGAGAFEGGVRECVSARVRARARARRGSGLTGGPRPTLSRARAPRRRVRRQRLYCRARARRAAGEPAGLRAAGCRRERCAPESSIPSPS